MHVGVDQGGREIREEAFKSSTERGAALTGVNMRTSHAETVSIKAADSSERNRILH